CIFGGWMIASSMDVIIASDDSLFLGANFQYFSMPWVLCPRKTKELLFDTRFILAHAAMETRVIIAIIPRGIPEGEVVEYSHWVAENDPFQLRMTKLAVNQAQDAQGFSSTIVNAHPLHLLSSMGEGDPGYALKKPEGQRRRPMVQRAIENREIYLRKRAKQ